MPATNIAFAKPGWTNYSTSGYYEAQFYSYPFPVLTFDTVCVPHSSRKCCNTLARVRHPCDDTDIRKIIHEAKTESIDGERRKYSLYLANGLFEELSAACFTTPTC